MLLSAACAMATARFIQEMPVTCACSGKDRASGLTSGADGARTMMLVYSLPQTGAIFNRFGGINGSAYLVGGFGMTALTGNTYRCGANPLRDRSATWSQSRLA